MTKDTKTISQLAHDFHVTRQAIYKVLNEKFKNKYTSKENNSLSINLEGQKLLQKHFQKSKENQDKTVESTVEKQLTNSLQEQIKRDDQIITNYQSQVKKLHQLLDQEQQLRLTEEDKTKNEKLVENHTHKSKNKHWWQKIFG